jgi:ABC-2 type transport system permease protein
MTLKRVRCLLRKEVAQLLRDPRLMRMLIIAPVIQLLVMGFAANTDVRDADLAVRDQDHTYHSRELTRALGASGYFHTLEISDSEAHDAARLVNGRTGIVLVIPAGFGKDLVNRRPASVQALVDGADSNFGIQGVNYLQKAVRLFSERMLRDRAGGLANSRTALPGITMETRVWHNPDLLSPQYLVPAIMALLLMVTTMLVTSMALVKEREDGTLEQMIVTPLRPAEIIAGKLLPFVGVGFVEVTLAIPIIVFLFHVPLRGSLILLYAMSGLFLLTTLGLGLLVSTLVKTQQQAMMVSNFFVMMPFVLLSGFAFPVENMPPAIQLVTHLIPLKYFMIIIRGIFLKGAGLHDLWPQALMLLVWGAVVFTLAALKFHKRLE